MKKTGFTLVELVIVIVIVGILSAISVPVYRGYIEKAIMAEGQTLLSAIGKAELAYHLQNKRFLAIDKTGYSPELNVDARGGKYFKTFYAELSGSAMSGIPVPEQTFYKAVSSVQKVTYYGYGDSAKFAVYIEVYGKYKKRDLVLYATQYASGALVIGDRFSDYYNYDCGGCLE